MSRLAALAIAIAVATGGASLVGAQRSVYRLPLERSVALPTSAGSDLTAAHCGACHSLDYLVTQPRGKGAAFWRDSVAKMRTVYGADLTDEDAAAIGVYLGRTFG